MENVGGLPARSVSRKEVYIAAAGTLMMLACVVAALFVNQIHNPHGYSQLHRKLRLQNVLPVLLGFSCIYFARFNVGAANNNRTRITLHTSPVGYGVVISAAYLSAMVALYICSHSLEIIGGRRIFVASLLGCAFTNCLIATLLNFEAFRWQFTLVTLECINYAFCAIGICAAIKLCASWYSVRERATFAAVFNTFSSLGIFLSFVGGPVLTDSFSWWTIFAIPGLLLVAAAAFAADVAVPPPVPVKSNGSLDSSRSATGGGGGGVGNGTGRSSYGGIEGNSNNNNGKRTAAAAANDEDEDSDEERQTARDMRFPRIKGGNNSHRSNASNTNNIESGRSNNHQRPVTHADMEPNAQQVVMIYRDEDECQLYSKDELSAFSKSLMKDFRFLLSVAVIACNSCVRDTFFLWNGSWADEEEAENAIFLRLPLGIGMAVASVVGGFASSAIWDHFFHDRLSSLLCFSIFQVFSSISLFFATTHLLRVVLISLFFLSLGGVYCVSMHVIIIDFGAPNLCGLAAVIAKIFECGGCVVSGIIAGYVIDTYGFISWKIGMCLISCVSLVIVIARFLIERAKAKDFNSSRPKTPIGTPRYFTHKDGAEYTPLRMESVTPRTDRSTKLIYSNNNEDNNDEMPDDLVAPPSIRR